MTNPDTLRAMEDHAKACETAAKALDYWPGMSLVADHLRITAAWWRAFAERAGR